MKKYYKTLILIILSSFRCVAQSNEDQIRNNLKMWAKAGETHYVGKILTIDLYAKRSSWGLGQQFYAGNVHNTSKYRIRYTGELYANLLCNNEATSKFDFTLNSDQSLIKASLDDLNIDFLSDKTGLINSADKELCVGEPIMINGKQYGINRIKGLGYRNIKAYAIINGKEVPIDGDGILHEKQDAVVSTSAPRNQAETTTSGVSANTRSATSIPVQATNSNPANTTASVQREPVDRQAQMQEGIQNTTNQNIVALNNASNSSQQFGDAVAGLLNGLTRTNDTPGGTDFVNKMVHSGSTGTDYMNHGDEAFNKGDYKKAFKNYSNALEKLYTHKTMEEAFYEHLKDSSPGSKERLAQDVSNANDLYNKCLKKLADADEALHNPPAESGAANKPANDNKSKKKIIYPHAVKFITKLKDLSLNIQLFSSPSLESQVVYNCPKGATVEVTEDYNEYYCKATVNGYSGYLPKGVIPPIPAK